MNNTSAEHFVNFLFSDHSNTFEISFVNIFKTFEQQVENANNVVEYLKKVMINPDTRISYWILGPDEFPGRKDYYAAYRLSDPSRIEPISLEDLENIDFDIDNVSFTDEEIERDDQIDLVQSTIVVDCSQMEHGDMIKLASEIYRKFDVEIEFKEIEFVGS